MTTKTERVIVGGNRERDNDKEHNKECDYDMSDIENVYNNRACDKECSIENCYKERSDEASHNLQLRLCHVRLSGCA